METLNKVVDNFVDNSYERQNLDIDLIAGERDFSAAFMKDAIKKNIKERIINEILVEKKKEIDKYSANVIEEERKKSSIIEIKELLWEAFLVAIFVSLLGNEITSLTSYFKSLLGEENVMIYTIVLIVVYGIIVLSLYVIKFTKDLIHKIVDKS